MLMSIALYYGDCFYTPVSPQPQLWIKAKQKEEAVLHTEIWMVTANPTMTKFFLLSYFRTNPSL